MRITIIHRYFWPDNAPYAQMLFKIARVLQSAGHSVSVLTSQPSHHWEKEKTVVRRENIDGVDIHRLPLLPEFGRKTLPRALNTVLFSLEIFVALLVRKADVVMVATTPPVVMALIVNAVSRIRHFKYVYHCQDIHPEAMAQISAINSNGGIYRFLQRLDMKNVERASAVVVLSNDMKNTLLKRGSDGKNIRVLNNFVFDAGENGGDTPKLDKGYFNVLFAGNLGKFQSLDVVIDAANILSDNNRIRFIFLGDGVERDKLERSASGLLQDTVFFLGHVSISDALKYMGAADIGLITIAKGVIDVAYPSKTMMYLSAGLPLVVMVEGDSELSQFVESEKLGYTNETGSPQSLSKAIEDAYKERMRWRESKSRIKRLAEDLFSEEVVLQKWVDLYTDIDQ